MRILFAGTPAIAVPSLRLAAAEHTVVGVLTNPDRAAGRGKGLSSSAVKDAALGLGLRVLQPEKLDAAFRETVRGLQPELLVAVAYGRIFGPQFLGCFPRGGINLHPSLLPLYRGPSPLSAAILHGEAQTGVTIQVIAPQMDAGDILAQETIALTGRETADSLGEIAAEKGACLLVKTLALIAEGRESRVPQDPAAVSYCGLLTRETGKIDWTASAAHIERMIRAFDPWPGAWTVYKGAVLRILAAEPLPSGGTEAPGKVLGVDTQRGILVQTGDGVLAVRRLQLEAKKALDFASFLNGVRGFTGSVLGDIQGVV